MQWALITGTDAKWLQTGESPRPDGDPDGGLGDECAIRDSNPEPADSEHGPGHGLAAVLEFPDLAGSDRDDLAAAA